MLKMMEATAIIEADGSATQFGVSGLVPWWSFTKLVLSVATLRLSQDGQINLDDKLLGERFTTRQLLRHESGLPDYGAVARYHSDVAAGRRLWPVSRLLKTVDAGRLRYEPGDDWAYSNIGYLRVAQLIVRAAGLPLATALATLVFDPAGLNSPRLATQPADLANVSMGRATGYHPGWVFHGLVVGTLADAARLLWQLTNGHMLSSATFAEMTQGRKLPEHRSYLQPDPAYGLGLMLAANNPQDHPMGHGGEGPGSRISVYAKDNRVAAVWTTLPSRLDADACVYKHLGEAFNSSG